MTDGTLDLFTPHARRTDPWTSHDAADSMVEAAAAQRVKILNALRTHGPMTADQLDIRLRWRPTTAGRRTIELERSGQVVRTGDRQKTRSGRWADVYRITQTTHSDPTSPGTGESCASHAHRGAGHPADRGSAAARTEALVGSLSPHTTNATKEVA